jgi:hypothetical protein
LSDGRRAGLGLLVQLPVGALQLVVARIVLGWPSWPALSDFLFGDRPSQAGGVAAAQALLWLVVAVALLAGLVAALRAIATGGRRGRGSTWSVAVLAAGLIILAAGAGHHAQRGSPSLAGGSLREARAALAR